MEGAGEKDAELARKGERDDRNKEIATESLRGRDLAGAYFVCYFVVFKMFRNSFAVTMNGFMGKCFRLPVTRYASSFCFSTTTS